MPDQTDVLHRRFRAVSRTAHRAHLHFVRRVQMFEPPLEFNASARRVLHAEAAEISTDARLYHAHAFRVRLSRSHTEVRPNFRQIGFLDAQQIDALAAGNFHHRHVIFVRNIGDAAQLLRRRHSAPHARNHGKSSVLLNIRVYAVVNESRRPILVVSAAPQHVHHVTQRRLTDLAAMAVTIDIQRLLYGTNALTAQNFTQFFFSERNALAQNFLDFFLKLRHYRL